MNMPPKRCVLVVESSEIQTLTPAPEVEVVRGARKVRRKKRIARRRSRPETPLLNWKFEEAEKDEELVDSEKKKCSSGGGCRRGVKKEEDVMVSARKLAAGIRKAQPNLASSKERLVNREGGGEQLGFQLGDGHGGMMNLFHGNGQNLKSPMVRHVRESSRKNGHLCKIEPSIKMDSSDIEGATKWYPVYPKTSEGVCCRPN